MLSTQFFKCNKNKNYSTSKSKKDIANTNRISTYAILIGNIVTNLDGYYYKGNVGEGYVKNIYKNNKIWKHIHATDGYRLFVDCEDPIYIELNKYTLDELLDYLRVLLPIVDDHNVMIINMIMDAIKIEQTENSFVDVFKMLDNNTNKIKELNRS